MIPTRSLTDAARIPHSGTWNTDVRASLRQLLAAAAIEGIESVQFLYRDKRHEHANDKVFFVLATHDIRRDEKIVRLMLQFEGVDYDLVPAASAGMVPSAAAPLF